MSLDKLEVDANESTCEMALEKGSYSKGRLDQFARFHPSRRLATN